MKNSEIDTNSNTTTDASSDHSNNVEVFCRLKPGEQHEEDGCVQVINSQALKIVTPCSKISQGLRNEVTCHFKRILTPETSQFEVFDTVANDMVTSLIQGRNGLLFTYGITGSGKTYTLGGNSKDPGVLPRCVTTIYNAVKANLAPTGQIVFDKNGQVEFAEFRTPSNPHQKPKINSTICETPQCLRITNEECLAKDHAQYSIFISMVELYNNNISDLFDEQVDPITKLPLIKGLRENSSKGIFIPGLCYVPIRSVSEALTYYRKGKKRRKVAQTLLNTQSSRSHCIFTIYLVRVEQIDDNIKSARISQLTLCDLAGSERMNRTQNEGDRQKESSSINSSLMALRNCIETLRENQRHRTQKIIPYRDNRLTLMFRNFFEGDGKVRMIICLNSIPGDYEENLHVIKFAEYSQEVKTKAEIKPQNKEVRIINEDYVNISTSKQNHCYNPARLPFPSFPSSLLTSYDDTRTMSEIISYLHESERLRGIMRQEMLLLAEQMSRELARLEHENSIYRDKNSCSRTRYEDMERELSQIKHSHKVARTKIANLEEKERKYLNEISSLKADNDVLNQKYSNEKSARNILKRKLKEIQDHQVDQLERECHKRVMEATEDMKNQLRKQDQRLRVVKDVLQNTSNLPPLADMSNMQAADQRYQDPFKRKRRSGSNHGNKKKTNT